MDPEIGTQKDLMFGAHNMSGVVSPQLLGSTGVLPLTIVAPLPDLCRHLANCTSEWIQKLVPKKTSCSARTIQFAKWRQRSGNGATTGVLPLTIVAPLPDLCRHLANCIVRAEHEVFLGPDIGFSAKQHKAS
jgi:hypothetical protein